MKHEKLLIGAYVVCSILTFGHSFNHQEKTYAGFDGVELNTSEEMKSYKSLMCGMFFPFYWSIKLFEVRK
jgi:hypothetical protein